MKTRKIKERLSEAAREKQQVAYKITPMILSTDSSTETLHARREWHGIFKVMKGTKLQLRILSFVRVSFRFDD